MVTVIKYSYFIEFLLQIELKDITSPITNNKRLTKYHWLNLILHLLIFFSVFVVGNVKLIWNYEVYLVFLDDNFVNFYLPLKTRDSKNIIRIFLLHYPCYRWILEDNDFFNNLFIVKEQLTIVWSYKKIFIHYIDYLSEHNVYIELQIIVDYVLNFFNFWVLDGHFFKI